MTPDEIEEESARLIKLYRKRVLERAIKLLDDPRPLPAHVRLSVNLGLLLRRAESLQKYLRERFDEDTIQRYYVSLLEQVAAEMERQLRHLREGEEWKG